MSEKISRLTKSIRFISILFVVVLGLYLFMSNTSPLGAQVTYVWSSGQISELTPVDRVEKIEDGVIVKHNLVYFETDLSRKFEKAKVKIYFEEPAEQQAVEVGYKDRNEWHYNSKVLNQPLLNNMSKYLVGEGPYLYQREKEYDNIESFRSNPPKAETIGFYDFDVSSYISREFEIKNYKPSGRTISLNIPLRGKHTLYAYLEGETFEFNVEKTDLNWYEDPDPMVIKVYKESDLVYEATIDDDGDAKASKKLGPKQSYQISNPGPELPEPGVYKIVFEAASDTMITKLSTNLSSLVFEGPIYPVNNAEVYRGLVESTSPINIYTNSNYLSAMTGHDVAFQTLEIGDNTTLNIDQRGKEFNLSIPSNTELLKIVSPKSDIILNGNGYFSFAPDKFFYPLPFNSLQIETKEDLDKVNYVLSNYQAGIKLPNGSQVAELEFDISNAVLKNGKLSWLISAPGLNENNRELVIRNIEVEFTKKGWFE